MSTGNRLMICAMTLVALACIVAAIYRPSLAAALIPLAVAAIGALSPSALHQAPSDPAPAVAADKVDTVNVAPAQAEGS